MGYLLTVFGRIAEMVPAIVGMHKSFSLAGIFFLATPVCLAMGGYSMVILQKQGVPLFVAILLAMVGVSILGICYAYAYIKLTNESFAVLTLTSIVAFEALLKSWDSVTGGILGMAGVMRPDFLVSLPSLVLCGVVIAILMLGFEYILLRTPLGRSMRAMKEHPVVLTSLGSEPKNIGMSLVILASILSGVTGILYAWRVQFLDPSIASTANLMVVVTVALLAYRPRVSLLALATIGVIGGAELLRFTPLPSTLVGPMRLVIYSLLIIVLVRVFADRISTPSRAI